MVQKGTFQKNIYQNPHSTAPCGACKNANKILPLQKPLFMPLKLYLDKRQNKYGESPIRIVWSFNGDRYQTTLGFSIPPQAWDSQELRVTPAAYNHKNTLSTTINAFIIAIKKAVNRMENYARIQNATLAKPIVKQVIADVLEAGGVYPATREPMWKKMLKERGLTKPRYFEHFKGGKYKLIGFGKDSETLDDEDIYQALYGAEHIWVRPYKIFFSKVKLPDGTEVERFKEIEEF